MGRPEIPTVSPHAGRALVRLARRELEVALGLRYEAAEPVPVIQERVGGVFATLESEGELRGCIGFLLSEHDTVSLTKRAVVAAAQRDPRFGPVTKSELPRLRIRISLLSEPFALENPLDIELGRHGLIVERSGARGLLLPKVAVEQGWSVERFLAETCRKAGLDVHLWRDRETVVSCFEALEFAEED